MPNETEKLPEPKLITDLKSLLVKGKTVELDPTEDAWEYSAPPDHNIYEVKLFVAKDGKKLYQYDPRDQEAIYLNYNLECRTIHSDPDLNNIPVFANVSTRCGKRKNISTMAGLIIKLGYKLPSNSLNDVQVASLFEQALKKEPIMKVELDWRLSYSYKNKNGETVWKNVYNHQEEFPDTPDKKGKMTLIAVTDEAGNRQELRPQLYIAKWFGKGEPAVMAGSPMVSAPRAAVQQQTVAHEPAPVFAQASVVQPQQAVMSQVTQPQPAMVAAPQVAQQQVDEDMLLMLE